LMVGITENNFDGIPVVAFPSPTDGSIQFVIPAGYNGKLNLQLYDCSGKLVSNSKHAQTNFFLDLTGYPNGVYYFKLTDEIGNAASGKIQVLHSPH
jgi:hypothetical protein